MTLNLHHSDNNKYDRSRNHYITLYHDGCLKTYCNASFSVFSPSTLSGIDVSLCLLAYHVNILDKKPMVVTKSIETKKITPTLNEVGKTSAKNVFC